MANVPMKTVENARSAIEIAMQRNKSINAPFTPGQININAPRDVVPDTTKLATPSIKTKATTTVISHLAKIKAKLIKNPKEPLVIDDRDNLIYQLALSVVELNKTVTNQNQLITTLTERVNGMSKTSKK